MEWKYLFGSTILNRGYEYYLGGYVKDLKINQGMIRAKVDGSEFYDVEVMVENDEIVSMKCTCSYAKRRNHCKHMAATLYEYHQEFKPFSNHESEYQIDAEVEKYYRRIDMYASLEFFDDEEEAQYFRDKIDVILNYDMQDFMKKEAYDNVFLITRYMFQYIHRYQMADYAYELIGLDSKICDLWEVIIDKVNKEKQREMFEWFVNYYMKNGSDERGYLERILFDHFKDHEYDQIKQNLMNYSRK